MQDIRHEAADLQALQTPTLLGLQVTTKVKIYLFGIALFFIPFVLSGPQLLVWSIVNFLLIRVAVSLPLAYARPLVLVSSFATLSRGIMFGPFTPLMIYMIPAIRVGNFLLVLIVKSISKNWLGIITWGAIKALFLFSIAFILFQSAILPKIFLTAMWIVQLATVLIGGAVFLGVKKFIK